MSGTVNGSPIAIARIAPKNGAIEKYAPARAVPMWRSATMNSTRLMPSAKRP